VNKQIIPIVMAAVLIGSAVGYALRAVRRGAAPLNAFAAAFNLLASVVTSLLMLVHLVAVTWVAVARTGESEAWHSEYGFHFYSLWLFGMVTLWQAVILLTRTSGIRRGNRASIRSAMFRSLILVAVTAPVIPVQHFGAIPSAFGAINLMLLAVVLRQGRSGPAEAEFLHRAGDLQGLETRGTIEP
jgi:hypothetical protein